MLLTLESINEGLGYLDYILEFSRVQFCEITVAKAEIVIREITSP
jgi:hypothetical protein